MGKARGKRYRSIVMFIPFAFATQKKIAPGTAALAKSAWRGGLMVVLAALLLAGCASSGPMVSEVPGARAEPPPGKARLYFYRTELPLFTALQPQIIVNSRAVGSSIYGEAFYRDAFPGGYHVYLADDPDDSLTFKVRAGETAYVKTDIFYGIGSNRLTLKLVEPKTGREEIAGKTLVDPANKTE